MPKLAVSDLSVSYRRLVALKNVSFDAAEGERIFISGPNGAGKSSLLKAISGAVLPSHGQIEIEGKTVNGLGPESIARAGVSLVPEGREVFGGLTVEENLRVGTGMRSKRESIQADLDEVYSAFPVLKERRRSSAGALSGGQQQMLVIGRALMTNPSIMLVDEPSLGLAPVVVEQVYEKLLMLQAERRLTLVIVEQSSTRAAQVGGRMLLLQGGRIVRDGDARQFASEDLVSQAYFGSIQP